MTVKDLEKLRDDLVKIPGVEKDVTIALYNLSIALIERLDMFLEKTTIKNMFGFK
jgi:hypothetical protein